MSTHLAAVAVAKGQPFQIQTRPTPKPGPGELLIAVKSVALNPADNIIRDEGRFIAEYPTVIGFDIAGLVIEIGEDVPSEAVGDGSTPYFQPGITRVAAYAGSFWKSFNPNYGAFQERCIVPWQHAIPLPENGISWNHAATLPVSLQVPLSAWDTMGIPRLGEFTGASGAHHVEAGRDADDVNQPRAEALLIWGASSSVGSMGVQTARLLQQDPKSPFTAVYATAGQDNHDFVRSLGASRVFDYKEPSIVENIVNAAKEDGVTIRHCFLATGQLSSCQAVLKCFLKGNGSDDGMKLRSKIASAPVIPADVESIDGIDTLFIMPSMVEEESLEQFRYWIGSFSRTALSQGSVKPSPEPTVVGKGLHAINSGLDRLRQGVSCTKLVIEIDE